MNIKQIARSVHNKLQKTKDITLVISKDNKYEIIEYGRFSNLEKENKPWDILQIDFNYLKKDMPTEKEINDFLNKIFKKTI